MRLTYKEKQEIRRLRWQLTNKQLYAHINAQRSNDDKLAYTTFRSLVYKMGLKKCKILRWTDKETDFLLANYKTMGNIEIARNLHTKRRPFTKKNVEKKMELLGIKRTREELNFIISKHKQKGTYSKANYKHWQNRKLKEGETKVQIRNGRPLVMIKVKGKLIPYARHRYLQLHGSIPKGCKIYFKDMNPLNIADSNLIAQPAHGYTSEQRAIYDRHVRNYFISQKFKQERQTAPVSAPVLTTKKQATIPVRIDSKTIIYVKAGTNIEAFIENYKRKRMIV